MTDGIVLIDKPAGMTSFGVVARVRRVLSKQAGKKVKVGHTGTLDPFATGLMILVTGKECKNAQLYSKKDKTYEAEFTLGEDSSTGDVEGDKTQISERAPKKDEILEAMKSLTGEIEQIPPVFSAIKINGKRAYDLAREGKEVEMPKRKVNIYEFSLLDYEYPKLKVRASVSSGTYIRTLAVDLGKKLETGAYCSRLRRTEIEDKKASEALTLKDFGVES